MKLWVLCTREPAAYRFGRTSVVAADKDLAEGAAIFKYDFKVPFVDAFAGSLALHENATLVTADYDFKSVPSGTIKIEFLPAK